MDLKPAQIGRCGELLVQYRLLKFGIESAPLTTDSGIDLVAYAPDAYKLELRIDELFGSELPPLRTAELQQA